MKLPILYYRLTPINNIVIMNGGYDLNTNCSMDGVPSRANNGSSYVNLTFIDNNLKLDYYNYYILL